MVKINDNLSSINTPSFDKETSNNLIQTSLTKEKSSTSILNNSLRLELENAGLQIYAERLSQCDKSFYYLQCDACQTKIMSKFYCGLSICPICQYKRSLKFVRDYEPYIKTFENPRLMTLTLKNVKFITPDDFKRFSKYFLALKRKLKSWNLKLNKGVRVLEVTEKGKGYHIHYHLLYDGSYIPQDFLSKAWGRITGGSFIVDIRVVRHIHQGLTYLAKYINKVPDMSAAKTVNFLIASKNVRVVQTFGTRFKVSRPNFKMICPVCGFDQFCFCTYLMDSDKVFTEGPQFILSNPPPMKQKELLSYFDNQMDKIIPYLNHGPGNAENIENILGKQDLNFMLKMGYIYEPYSGEYKKV